MSTVPGRTHPPAGRRFDPFTDKGSGTDGARGIQPSALPEQATGTCSRKQHGIVITKKRYVIPLDTENLKAELDIFEGRHEGLRIVEVEFESEEQANRFAPPAWFGEDVTFDGRYHNSHLSQA